MRIYTQCRNVSFYIWKFHGCKGKSKMCISLIYRNQYVRRENNISWPYEEWVHWLSCFYFFQYCSTGCTFTWANKEHNDREKVFTGEGELKYKTRLWNSFNEFIYNSFCAIVNYKWKFVMLLVVVLLQWWVSGETASYIMPVCWIRFWCANTYVLGSNWPETVHRHQHWERISVVMAAAAVRERPRTSEKAYSQSDKTSCKQFTLSPYRIFRVHCLWTNKYLWPTCNFGFMFNYKSSGFKASVCLRLRNYGKS